ncbi:hypothetical protein AB1N83_011207 [Pleurotus pulmonarius]
MDGLAGLRCIVTASKDIKIPVGSVGGSLHSPSFRAARGLEGHQIWTPEDPYANPLGLAFETVTGLSAGANTDLFLNNGLLLLPRPIGNFLSVGHHLPPF